MACESGLPGVCAAGTQTCKGDGAGYGACVPGVAKGAMLTQANMVANLQQVGAWIARDLIDGKETTLIPLPLYHVFALTANLVVMKIGDRKSVV